MWFLAGRCAECGRVQRTSAYADAPPIVRNKPELLSRAFADDYPARAAREEREGRVKILVSVSPHGRVSDCVVAASSGSADLDEAACNSALRRARYRPATDAGGVPMATANVREAVNYKLH